jgi:Secretion system C-terminal sorting domain
MHKLLRFSFLSFTLFAFAGAKAQSISISSSTSDTICSGTMVTYSATPSGVGTPHYQWLKNSVHVGVDSSHYSTSGLSTSDVIMCELLNVPGGTILALSGPIVMTVDHLPAPGSITGTSSLCTGSTTTLTIAASGGSWASRRPFLATVSSVGVVTGAAAGLDTITYTVTNSCGTGSVIFPMTINGTPALPPITGPATACVGVPANFTDTVSGGTWSVSDTAFATITSTGVVTPIAPGTDTVFYRMTNGCGTTTRRRPFNIAIPPSVTAIFGSDSVCANDTIHIFDGANGGVWRSSNNAIAVIGGGPGAGPGGAILRGISGGTVTISYTVVNACGADSTNKSFTVNSLPMVYPIYGTQDSVCQGSVLGLIEFTTGGTWSSKFGTIATVDGSGNVTGVAAGVDTIFYSVTNSCGTVTQPYPVYVYCPAHVGTPSVTLNNKINIYPNPATDMINIEGVHPSSVQILNIYGQNVKNISNANSFSVKDLPQGIYYMTVFDQNGQPVCRQSLVKY